MATASQPSQGIKNGMKILVIGRNGIGKSSLINKILGANRATEGDNVKPTEHKVVEEIHHPVGENDDVPVIVYDTRGFGDTKIKGRSIIASAVLKMKSADIVLICHRLYERFDESSELVLREIVRALGDDLMQHTIIVFTKGDQYKSEFDKRNAIMTRKEHMEKQERAIKEAMKVFLISQKIKEEIVRDIPSIVTSREESLPTNKDGSKNWVKDFWKLCGQRCTLEAVGFVSWHIQNLDYLASGGITGAVLAGVAGGAVAGGIIGSPIVPGIGTVAGAVAGGIGGAIAGAIAGGVGGMGATAIGLKVTQEYQKEKEIK